MPRLLNPFRSGSATDCYKYIAEQFVKKLPVDERAYKRVATPSGRGSYPGGSGRKWPGGPRMYIEDNTLFSYGEHFPLAQWVNDGEDLIANADYSPSTDTTAHQTYLRDAAKAVGLTLALIPYSVLEAPGIRPERIQVIDVTPDRDDFTKERQRHFLGETLFMVGTRYYVCGLDRNDNPRLGKFFIARLPDGVAAHVVESALDTLRPEGIFKDAKRQGEWFFEPVPSQLQRSLNRTPSRYKVPIIDADSLKQRQQFTAREIAIALPLSRGATKHEERLYGRRVQTDGLGWRRTQERADRTRIYRMGRHVAEREICGHGGVYVKGVIQDQEHDPLDLGARWHKVVRNLADGSWSMPESAGGRARVD